MLMTLDLLWIADDARPAMGKIGRICKREEDQNYAFNKSYVRLMPMKSNVSVSR